jgi:hypothetical protein
MIAKSIIGIIIIALNLAGVCCMAFMALARVWKKSEKAFRVTDRTMKTKRSRPKKRQTLDTTLFNKADYLLDDIDLSEFDNLDLDQIQNQNDGDEPNK